MLVCRVRFIILLMYWCQSRYFPIREHCATVHAITEKDLTMLVQSPSPQVLGASVNVVRPHRLLNSGVPSLFFSLRFQIDGTRTVGVLLQVPDRQGLGW